MKALRSTIATTLSLALVLLSPGHSAFHAAAQTMGAATSASGSSAASGVSGAQLGRGTGVNAIPSFTGTALLTPGLSAPSLSAPVLGAVAAPASILAAPSAVVAPVNGAAVVPSALTPAVIKAAASKPVVAPAIVPAAKSVASALQASLTNNSAASKGDKLSGEQQVVEAAKTFDGAALKTGILSAAVKGDETGTAGKQHLVAAKKDSGKGMPDSGDKVDGTGRPIENGGDIDELGNPRRTGGEGGPDDRSDPDQRSGGNSGLFALMPMFATGLFGGGALAVAGMTMGTIAMFPMIIISLVLHEIGHARMAAKLGDPTATLQNRASFNPKHWMTHIDPVWTLLIPALTFFTTGMIFGGARPVPVEPRYFKNPSKGMAIVALAGPAVNIGLAVAGGLAITGAIAAGLGSGVIAMLFSFVFLNALLAIFNMIPLPPLDGSHILKSFLPWQTRNAIDSFFERMGPMGFFLPLIILFYVAGGWISGAAMFLAKLIVGGAIAATGVQMASAFLPALAAAGLLIGQLAGQPQDKPKGEKPAEGQAAPQPADPNNGANAAGAGAGPVDLIVMFDGSANLRGAKITADAHINAVDVNLPNGVDEYTRVQQAMQSQLNAIGLTPEELAPYQGTPRATYERINAATIRVEGAKAAEFTKLMTDRGFTVHQNSRREIIRPVPVTPEQMDPTARGAVTASENLKIIKADVVQAIAVQKWGKPEMSPWQRFWARVTGKAEPVQPKFGVIDSGIELSHPQAKRVKEAKNMTSGDNVDDIGHGTWVHTNMLSVSPWAKNTTHYKTFLNGGATLDDILRSLTQAGNDGNLVISNSWGSDDGDPNGPDSQLVLKLAQQGHIMVFAAGNAGPRKNTVGSPAIVHYKDAKTGAIRVIAVAAAGRDGKHAYFSSVGPGSGITSRTPGYPHKPDAMAVGYNIEAGWPAALGDADRTDGENGPVKAISGTSMATPGFAGAIELLAMMFGVTETGEKLDAVVNAVMSTLTKGKNHVDQEGEGFLNVEAAYNALLAQFGPNGPDVKTYRALKDRLSVVESFRNMTGSWRYGVMIKDTEWAKANQEISDLRIEIAKMEQTDPTLKYRAAGPVKKFFMRLAGAAPKA